MRSSLVADAVILSPRKEVQKVAAEHLKMKGVSNILMPSPDENPIEAVDRFPKALLVIDWELGAPVVASVLGHNRRKYPGQLRPTLLIAKEVSEQIVATAAEYGVTQIFTEAVTPKNLGARLASLLLAESMPNELKKGLADAAELRNGNDHKGAFHILQTLWQKNPSNLRIKCEVAETLMHLDQPENALKVLAGIDQTKPPYLRGIHLLGRCLMKLGRFDEAVKSLESANLFNPHDAERLADIGHAFMQMDRLKEASEKMDAALAVDPNYRPAKLGKGQLQLLDGHVNEALALLRDVASTVELASMFNTSAVMSMRRGRHETGMNLYQSAIKALGRDDKLQARLYFNMGIGFRRWGKPDRALACFESAQRLDPSYQKAREQAILVAAMPPPPAAKAPAAPLPKAASADPHGLIDFGGGFDSSLSKVLNDDDLEESLFD